jgi:hypothetical protein
MLRVTGISTLGMATYYCYHKFVPTVRHSFALNSTPEETKPGVKVYASENTKFYYKDPFGKTQSLQTVERQEVSIPIGSVIRFVDASVRYHVLDAEVHDAPVVTGTHPLTTTIPKGTLVRCENPLVTKLETDLNVTYDRQCNIFVKENTIIQPVWENNQIDPQGCFPLGNEGPAVIQIPSVSYRIFSFVDSLVDNLFSLF